MVDAATQPDPTQADREGISADQARIADLSGQRAAGAASFDAQMKPLESGLNRDYDEQTALAAKGPEKVPMPQWERPKLDPKEMESLSLGLMALALIGGAVSHGNWLGVGASLNGTMEGVVEGNKEKFQNAYQDYQTKYKEALDHEKQADKAFEDVLRDKNLSINQKQARMRALAAEHDRQDIRLATSIDQMYKQIDAHRSAIDRVESANNIADRKLSVSINLADKREKGGGGAALPGGWSQDQIDYYARQQMTGDWTWRTGLARTKEGVAIIRAVDQRVPELARENDITPEEASTTKDQRHSLARALDDRTKYVAAADQFIGNFKRQEKLVEKYLQPGVGGSVPAINKWIQHGRTAIEGDPAVTELDTVLRGLAREHQRIVTGVTSNAQLHASAQQTADDLLNRDQTAAQIRGSLKVMDEEANNALAEGRREVAGLRSQLSHLGVAGKKADKDAATPRTNAKGWTLHQDAKGNKAYVSPDGKQFEEVR